MNCKRATHVRFGAKADIDEFADDVRFTPESGHQLSASDVRYGRSVRRRAFSCLPCGAQTEEPLIGGRIRSTDCVSKGLLSFAANVLSKMRLCGVTRLRSNVAYFDHQKKGGAAGSCLPRWPLRVAVEINANVAPVL